MVVAAIILLFFASVGWLGLRFGLKAAETSLGRAKVVLLSAVCSMVVFVLTLTFFSLANDQNEMATLMPVRSLADLTQQADDKFVLIEGRINEDMPIKQDSYVAFLRLERSLANEAANSTNALSSEPFSFDIDLTDDRHMVGVDASFTTQDRFSYDYYNWPSVRDTFYIYYYVERSTPVVVVGRPSGTAAERSLYDTRMMYVGTAEEYIANVSPTLMRWAYFGWTMSVVGLLCLIILLLMTLPAWQQIRQDDSFHWGQLLSEVRVG